MKKIISSVVFCLLILVPNVSSAYFTDQNIIEELQSQISSLLKQIQQLQNQIANQKNYQNTTCYSINSDLKIGDQKEEVSSLLSILVREGIAKERSSNFANSFDETMASYVSAFQEKYRSEVLTPAGLSSPTGYVGARTRSKLNSLYGCDVVKPTPTPNPNPVACTMDAKVCPDGSYVGRSGLYCEFSACPTTELKASITVNTPNGGENWEIGKTQKVSWSSSNAPSDSWVGRVALYQGINFVIDLIPFLSHSPVSGSTQYTVPVNSITGNNFKIQTILYRGESELAQDWSDRTFSITPTPQASILNGLCVNLSTTYGNTFVDTTEGAISLGGKGYVAYGSQGTTAGANQTMNFYSYVPDSSVAYVGTAVAGSQEASYLQSKGILIASIESGPNPTEPAAKFGGIIKKITNYAPGCSNYTRPTQSEATLSFSQTSFNFSYFEGESIPPVQNLTFKNNSDKIVSITLKVPNQPSWLDTSYTTNIINSYPNQETGLLASVDPKNLNVGTYTTNIIVTGNFVGSPLSIPVTLTIRD